MKPHYRLHKVPQLSITQAFVRTSRNNQTHGWGRTPRELALRCDYPGLARRSKLGRHCGRKIPLSIGTKAPTRRESVRGV